jgi:hypothetical protein
MPEALFHYWLSFWNIRPVYVANPVPVGTFRVEYRYRFLVPLL